MEQQSTATAEPVARFVTVGEFSDATGLGLSTTYRLCKNGEIPSVRFGSKIRIPAEVLEDAVGHQGGDA